MVALLTSSPLTVAWLWAAFPLINVKVNTSPMDGPIKRAAKYLMEAPAGFHFGKLSRRNS